MSSKQATATIYGLVDPRTHEIRYVGKTTWSLSHRLKGHRADAKSRPHTHRAHWLEQLASLGLCPDVVVLEVVPPEGDWEAAERFWISRLPNLTNQTEGGEIGGWGWLAGENCAHSKLTEAAVVDISVRFAAGGITQRELATEYGVSVTTVANITRGERWRHVERPITKRAWGAPGVSRRKGVR